jgi:hypothetical protein
VCAGWSDDASSPDEDVEIYSGENPEDALAAIDELKLLGVMNREEMIKHLALRADALGTNDLIVLMTKHVPAYARLIL